MSHTLFRATISLHTAFGTPLAGDTLFGQLCWAVREQLGNDKLTSLLEGYTSGNPWLVVSDGFPNGYLPKPTVPASLLLVQKIDAKAHKEEKSKHWIAITNTAQPLPEWNRLAVNDSIAFNGQTDVSKEYQPVEAVQPHNSLNRLTNTTGGEGFAPYTQVQTFFAPEQSMDLYLVLDEKRLSAEALKGLLQSIGSHGFGRDANIGLGKFSLKSLEALTFAQHVQANAHLTLAPSAPQGQGFNRDKSYWRVITRFGRHGNLHGISDKPFKNPILLASSGAVFSPKTEYIPCLFIGQGLGGHGEISKTESATVHQGYAPVIGIYLEV